MPTALDSSAQVLNVALSRGAQAWDLQVLNVTRGAQILNVALCRGAQRLRWGGRAESLAQGFGLRLLASHCWPETHTALVLRKKAKYVVFLLH